MGEQELQGSPGYTSDRGGVVSFVISTRRLFLWKMGGSLACCLYPFGGKAFAKGKSTSSPSLADSSGSTKSSSDSPQTGPKSSRDSDRYVKEAPDGSLTFKCPQLGDSHFSKFGTGTDIFGFNFFEGGENGPHWTEPTLNDFEDILGPELDIAKAPLSLILIVSLLISYRRVVSNAWSGKKSVKGSAEQHKNSKGMFSAGLKSATLPFVAVTLTLARVPLPFALVVGTVADKSIGAVADKIHDTYNPPPKQQLDFPKFELKTKYL